jgi:hypothetical protein
MSGPPLTDASRPRKFSAAGPAETHAETQLATGYYTVYLYRCDLKVAITTVVPIVIGQDLLFCQQ